jgi:ABC-type transport system substrate-binding protein
LTHAFRVDDWEGWQIVVGSGFTEPDTWYKVRLKEEAGGPLGGTLTIAHPEPLSTTNILTTNDGYVVDVMDSIYQPLYEFDPITWAAISAPGLAESWTVEKTTDPKGIKVTFNLIQNATWHDGQPATSEDVKFTYDLIQHSQAPYTFDDTKNIYKIETPDDYTVVVYSNASGLFEFHKLNLDWILPKHIWNAHWDDVLTWVPEGSDLIGSGPFKWNDWIAGEYIELVAYDKWPYKPPSTSSIDVDIEPASVSAGTNFGVVVTIDNTGIVPFTDMDVKITLPAGTSLATGTSTMTINRIAPGTSETVTWVVKGETAGSYTITVDATSAQYTGQQTASVEVVTYIYYYIAGAVVVAIVALVGGYILIRRRS